MEKSSKRGKIPQSDWPLIMARYEAGETLASIARTYDCSPPAISYVVSRSRARQPDMLSSPASSGVTEPQLVKTVPIDSASGERKMPEHPAASVEQPNATAFVNGAEHVEERPQPGPAAADATRTSMAQHSVSGLSRERGSDASFPGLAPRAALLPQRPPGPPIAAGPNANGDQRRTLHLSLGQGTQGNGRGHSAEPQPAERHNLAGTGQASQPRAPADHFGATAHPEPQRVPAAAERGASVVPGQGFSEMRPQPYQGPVRAPDPNSAHRGKDIGGAFIDQELRARVDGDIAAFLAAFDAALAEDTQTSRSALREATDRLLRAGARTRIELERLEARMPLSPRDNGGRGEPVWRQR